MLYIRKKRTPDAIEKTVDEIKKTPGSGYEEIHVPEDSQQLRALFDMMPKNDLRNELYKEQHGLCAYCMKRITGHQSDTRIEHYKALSTDKKAALDYQNFLGVCYGGEKGDKVDSGTSCLCCDAARGEKELTINPWNKRQMEAIGYYKKTGEIFVRQDVGLGIDLQKALQRDIDDVLVASRRCICDSVCSQFERWSKKGILTADFLQDKIEKLEEKLRDDNIADEYIGVRLYLYKRKEEKLRRKH